MITLTQVTEILGWASILNIGFLFFTTIMLITMKSLIVSIHSKTAPVFEVLAIETSLSKEGGQAYVFPRLGRYAYPTGVK